MLSPEVLEAVKALAYALGLLATAISAAVTPPLLRRAIRKELKALRLRELQDRVCQLEEASDERDRLEGAPSLLAFVRARWAAR